MGRENSGLPPPRHSWLVAIKDFIKMRLLVVEDGEKVVRTVTLRLRAEKFAVDETCDGRAGPAMASEIPYRLIVDLILPEQSGRELISGLQQHKLPVSILILTASDAMGDEVTNFKAGSDDYLTKPLAFAELLTRVKALLKRGSAYQPNCFCVGGLEIDRISHQVKRNGITIKLTAKEYAVLEYLAANAGRVLTRKMIMERVWDQTFEGVTNVVDVYIRQLRAKIDETFHPKLIHTFRKAGYSLSDEAQK
jgi:two-component system copper resistance phosphate regulon response regulator CusR